MHQCVFKYPSLRQLYPCSSLELVLLYSELSASHESTQDNKYRFQDKFLWRWFVGNMWKMQSGQIWTSAALRVKVEEENIVFCLV